jgi:hypothetical protein
MNYSLKHFLLLLLCLIMAQSGMAKKAVSEKSLIVLNYLKEHQGENMTAQDIADALDMPKKSVDGIVTSGLIRGKNYAERIPAEIELEDGSHREVKFIQATADGLAYDDEAAKAEDAAATE